MRTPTAAAEKQAMITWADQNQAEDPRIARIATVAKIFEILRRPGDEEEFYSSVEQATLHVGEDNIKREKELSKLLDFLADMLPSAPYHIFDYSNYNSPKDEGEITTAPTTNAAMTATRRSTSAAPTTTP